MPIRSMPGVRGSPLVRVTIISPRSVGDGNCTKSGLSSLPGLSIAGSIMSGLFVAPTTKTPVRSPSPSSSVNSVLTTLADDSD